MDAGNDYFVFKAIQDLMREILNFTKSLFLMIVGIIQRLGKNKEFFLNFFKYIQIIRFGASNSNEIRWRISFVVVVDIIQFDAFIFNFYLTISWEWSCISFRYFIPFYIMCKTSIKVMVKLKWNVKKKRIERQI